MNVCRPLVTCTCEIILLPLLFGLELNEFLGSSHANSANQYFINIHSVKDQVFMCNPVSLCRVEDALKVARIDQKGLASARNFFLVSCVRIYRVWIPFSLYGRECADQIVAVVNSAHGYLVSWQIWHWEYLDCCLPQGKGGRCDPCSTTTHPSRVTWIPNL